MSRIFRNIRWHDPDWSPPGVLGRCQNLLVGRIDEWRSRVTALARRIARCGETGKVKVMPIALPTEGEATSAVVVDVHHHVGAAPAIVGASVRAQESAMHEDLVRRIEYMDAFGIDQAVVMTAAGLPAPNGFSDRKRLNTVLASYRMEAPDRFVAALGSVNPGDGELAIEELNRCIEGLGMRGMVWHHRFDGMPIDDARMDPLIARLAHYGVPAFVHLLADSTLEAPWRLEVLADRFPEVQFVALDAFSCTSHAHWMQYIATKHPNIAFDTAVMVSVGHALQGFIQKVGPERLCLGTNFYSTPRLFGTPLPLIELQSLGLTALELKQVIGGNAHKILKLDD